MGENDGTLPAKIQDERGRLIMLKPNFNNIKHPNTWSNLAWLQLFFAVGILFIGLVLPTNPDSLAGRHPIILISMISIGTITFLSTWFYHVVWHSPNKEDK